MNETKQLLLNLIGQDSVSVSIQEFIINMIITIILGYFLSRFFVRYGRSLSNRESLSTTLLFISITTMLIITIVKASLALSLGLVGALSIVRFRTAIKEPEELAYFFMAIGIGLGLGANQKLVTVVGFLIIFSIILLNSNKLRKTLPQMLILNIGMNSESMLKPSVEDLINIIKTYCSKINIKRIDESEDNLELGFELEFREFSNLIQLKNSLIKDHPTLHFSFLEVK